MALRTVALLLLVSSFTPYALGEEVQVGSAAELVAAAELANTYGKICNGAVGCFGEKVVALVRRNIVLSGPLPGIGNNAWFSVVGTCTPCRCIIDAAGKYKVFVLGPKGPTGPPGKLELRDLNFRNAVGGVISNVWAEVIATQVVFQNNVNSAVTSVGFFGGMPLMTFDTCQFVTNSGSAINVGSNKLGLAAARDGVGLIVRLSQFTGNTGGINGGAASIAGKGKAIFDNCQFAGNTASGTGGAVFADQTQVIFKGALFSANGASGGTSGGSGGAVSGEVGVFQNTTVSFCSSVFLANVNLNNLGEDSLLFTSAGFNLMTVNFCDTPIPRGSTFVTPPLGEVNRGVGSSCAAMYCN